jgi:hypothetical protein
MVRQPGTRAKSAAGANARISAGARTISFFLLVATGMAVLLAVVLLPAWAECLQVEYQRDGEKADLADIQELLAAYNRKIRSIETDTQLARRHALGILGLDPGGLAVELVTDTTNLTPGEISVTPSPRPDAPSDWLIAAAQKVEDPPTRRGLLLLAAGAVITAVYLFDPSGRRRAGTPHPPEFKGQIPK